jgi:hypothetical protein
MHREERRKLWINRIEWAAFVACLLGGGIAVWLFVVVTP